MSTRKRLRIVNGLFLAAGIALLAVLLTQIDLAALWAHLRRAGWMLLPALGAFAFNLMLSTGAWSATFQDGPRPPSFRRLLGAFWAGHALNALTSGGSGEVLKGTLLARDVEGDDVVASLVVYNYLMAVVMLGATVVGPLLCLVFVQLPTRVVVAVLVTALLMLVGLLVARTLLRKGLAGALLRLAGKLPLLRDRNLGRFETRAKALDERVWRFRRAHPRAFTRVIVLGSLVRVGMVAELWFYLLAMVPGRDAGSTFLLALLLQSATQIVVLAASFVPGQIGVFEGGAALLFQLLGFDPAIGLAVALLRRARTVVSITAGLGVGAVMEARLPQRATPETPEP